MKIFAKPIFQDTKHGLAKQVLNIAITEGMTGYFMHCSNFELTIELTKAFTETNAREYFAPLMKKIKTEGLTKINFKERNDFFLPDEEKGFRPF